MRHPHESPVLQKPHHFANLSSLETSDLRRYCNSYLITGAKRKQSLSRGFACDLQLDRVCRQDLTLDPAITKPVPADKGSQRHCETMTSGYPEADSVRLLFSVMI